jgi:RNA polymerase sigma-70 factor (ECF subfamily)
MNSQSNDPHGQKIREAIHKATNGNMAAFEELYAHYLTPIYRFVFFRVKSREEAEDITQNVFLKAWHAIKRYRDEGKPFSAWLYAIARNTVIDHWKKKKEVRLNAEDSEEIFAQIPDNAPNPAERMEQSDRARMVRKAIEHLSEDQQELVIMKFINDLSNKEISEITGKSEDAIRQMQFRALKALRELLSDK